MKIDCLSYFNPFVFNGGGEAVTRGLIEAGRKRGHQIRIRSVRPNLDESTDEPDLYWLIDVFNNPHTFKSRGAWVGYPVSLLNEIADRKPFVHMNHAYADVCNLPYLPCSGEAASVCSYKTPSKVIRNIVLKDFSRGCFSNNALARKLFERSKLNVYVSPLHQQTIENVLKLERKPASYVLKPLIDNSLFYNRNQYRDIDYLFVGVISEAKGLHNLRAMYKDKDIHFVGKIAPGAVLDFGTYHGVVRYAEIPKYMNRAKNFVFLPRWPEPQGRVVVEAALCGCTLVTNDNVGATTFPFDISEPNNFAAANEEFWEKIEGINL